MVHSWIKKVMPENAYICFEQLEGGGACCIFKFYFSMKIMHISDVKHDNSIYIWCAVTQLYLTLCDPIGCSSLGYSVHGISQARILEWIAVSSSRGSSWPRDRPHIFFVSQYSHCDNYYCQANECSIPSPQLPFLCVLLCDKNIPNLLS